ncbi:MAG: hypothetical protein A2W26_10810 [Acidobacteria bacterium RBG_16_64_8]|nr:MAG: hypothetical protein A2W26_10810 [Acidobacteria bacterium RBG_16_64_8]
MGPGVGIPLFGCHEEIAVLPPDSPAAQLGELLKPYLEPRRELEPDPLVRLRLRGHRLMV